MFKNSEDAIHIFTIIITDIRIIENETSTPPPVSSVAPIGGRGAARVSGLIPSGARFVEEIFELDCKTTLRTTLFET